MSGLAARYGMTLTEACALVVGGLGRPTTAEVFQFLAADGWDVSRYSVYNTLCRLAGGPVEVAVQGKAGSGPLARWRLSEAGRAWVAEGERCGT